MTKALVTGAQHPGVYFLEKWLPDFEFVYGDTSFITHISATQQLLLPTVSQPDYIHQLLNICLDQQLEAVFAMSFAEQGLLAEATELFSEFNINLFLPDLLTRKLLFDPAEILQKLSFSGIKTVSFQLTSSFTEFSKACLQLGYPTETIAVSTVQNPELLWLVNDQLQTGSSPKNPVITFTKAAKIFTMNEPLLLRTFKASTQKVLHTFFNDGKLISVWNAGSFSAESVTGIGSVLKLNGLFEFNFQEEQLFWLKSFVVT